MKTTAQTTLPDNTHGRPIHEVKWSKWQYYLLSFFFVLFSWPIVCVVFFYFMNPTVEVRMVNYLLVYIIFISGTAYHLLIIGDIYFYERHVEMRRFLTLKKKVIYYDEIHVHIMTSGEYAMEGGTVTLSHYKTLPKFLKSPYTWFKVTTSEFISFPRADCTPEILEFLKTKAQSVNYYDKW